MLTATDEYTHHSCNLAIQRHHSIYNQPAPRQNQVLPGNGTQRKIGLAVNMLSHDNNNNNINKRQFVRRRNMSVDITRAPYRQSGNVVRDSSTETRL